MKKSYFFRTIVAVLFFTISSTSIFAQLTTSLSPSVDKSVAGEGTEYVTVGSTMPYMVTPFNWGSMASLMNASRFKWSVTNGTGTSAAIQESEIATDAGYYTQSQISIKWSATGTYTIKVNEKSMPKNGTGCEGGEETLPVSVLPWPTFAWGTNTDPSACGLTGPVVLNISLKGSQDIKVSYEVDYYAGVGATLTSTTPGSVTLNSGGYDAAKTGTISIPVAAANAGKYEVRIVNITDKITDKSFGTAATVAASALPTSYVFYNIPTPTTQPIQHITNL